MTQKKSAERKAARGVRSLPVKTLSSKQTRDVRGGKSSPLLVKVVTKGQVFKKVEI